MWPFGLEENGWSTKDPNRGKSYRLWAYIMKHKETFFKFSAFKLGNGNKIRFWKNSYDERQDTVLRKRTKKIPTSSDEIKRDRRVVTPQADRSDKM